MQVKNIIQYLFILTLVGLLSLQSAKAGSIVSVTSGDWTNGATWEGGVVPQKTDDVIIASGHTVTYFVNSSAQVDLCTNLKVDGTFKASSPLDNIFTTNVYGVLTCNGVIEPQTDFKGITTVFKGDTASVGGTGSIKIGSLNLSAENVTCNISIPSIYISDSLYISKNNAKLNIEKGAEVVMSPTGLLTVLNKAGRIGFNQVEVRGKLTTGFIELVNNSVNTKLELPDYSNVREDFIRFNSKNATFIVLKELESIRIYNIEGKCIFTQQDPEKVINLPELITGVYIVSARDTKNNNYNTKIIIQ